MTKMPHGVSGLLISAILAAAMSNLSAALNSLSSTTVVDFYRRWRPQASEERQVRVSRLATVGWGVVLFMLAMLARHGGRVLEVGLSITSVAYGSLLGVFLLGVLTKTGLGTGRDGGDVVWFRVERLPVEVHAGAVHLVRGSREYFATFVVGYGTSLLLPELSNRHER